MKNATGVYNNFIIVHSHKLNFLLGSHIIATLESSRGKTPSIYHSHCEVLVTQGSSRCECCKKHRKSLCALSSCHSTNDNADTIGQKTQTGGSKLGEESKPTTLEISLPISAYLDSSLITIEDLLRRLNKQGYIPSGTCMKATVHYAIIYG